MSVFDAKKKAGHDIGVRAVVVDENGDQISSTNSEWYGFSKDEANNKVLEIVRNSKTLVETWRDKGKSGDRPEQTRRDGR